MSEWKRTVERYARDAVKEHVTDQLTTVMLKKLLPGVV